MTVWQKCTLCRFASHLISLSICSMDPQICIQLCYVSFRCGYGSRFTWYLYPNLTGLPMLNKILQNFVAGRASGLLKSCCTPANVNQPEKKSNIRSEKRQETLLIFQLSFGAYGNGNLTANVSCALWVINTLRLRQNDRHHFLTLTNAFSWRKIYKFLLKTDVCS